MLKTLHDSCQTYGKKKKVRKERKGEKEKKENKVQLHYQQNLSMFLMFFQT